MTPRRVDLICSVVLVFCTGVAVANRLWLIVALAAPFAGFMLIPLWRLAGRHVEVAESAVRAAESDPSAKAARRATLRNGGLSAPDGGSEGHD